MRDPLTGLTIPQLIARDQAMQEDVFYPGLTDAQLIVAWVLVGVVLVAIWFGYDVREWWERRRRDEN